MLCTARPLTGCLEGARRRSLDKAVRRRSSRCAQARFHCDLCLAVATRPYLWRSGFYPLAVSCEAIGRSTTLPAHFLNDNMVATLPSLFRKHLRVRLAGRDGINRSRVVATGTPRTGKSPSLNPVTKACLGTLQDGRDQGPGNPNKNYHVRKESTQAAPQSVLVEGKGHMLSAPTEAGAILSDTFPPKGASDKAGGPDLHHLFDAAQGSAVSWETADAL